jgi:hypothetical protein
MAHGERIAMAGAGMQARMAPTREARRFLRRQAWQERFHVAVFANAAAALSADAHSLHHDAFETPPVLVDWREQINRALSRNRLIDSLLVQQVFLEGLGHVILRQLDRHEHESNECLARLGHMIQRQEEEHHQFGLRLLESELHLDPSARPRLVKLGRSLFQQAQDLLAGLSGEFEVLDPEYGDYVAQLESGFPTDVPGVGR